MRLSRYRRAPDLGPNILFFSGGTALRDLSRSLIQYTHNSTHLITPFDSGGSSAELRRAFRMLAVGDLRNRLMALADQSLQGQPEIFTLFSFRFPEDGEPDRLEQGLAGMVDGRDPMIASIDDPMRKIIRNYLGVLQERMPAEFNLRGANIGNLILAGGYLNQNRNIDPVIYTFSNLVEVRGVVRPISSEYLHLAAELESGEVLVGQHVLSGKESEPIAAPVKRLFLTRRQSRPEPVKIDLRQDVAAMIRKAEVICYPMGSFYTSLVANLLLSGVGQAVAETSVPKVFIPNTGVDPEQFGLSPSRSVEVLLGYLRESCSGEVATKDLLHVVLVDRSGGGWSPAEIDAVERLGVSVLDLSLVMEKSAPYLDAHRLAEVLVSLA